MHEDRLQKALLRLEEETPWRAECLARAMQLAMEDYIAACEEPEYASVFLAFALGQQYPEPLEADGIS